MTIRCPSPLSSIFFALALFQFGPNATSLIAEIDAEQVDNAIEQGIKYLTQQQAPNGSWSNGDRGVTSLCTLALLNTGLNSSDPQIRKALEYLRNKNISDNYSLALQTMIFCRAEPETDRNRIVRNVKWFETAQSRQGCWSYGHVRFGGDPSNSQFSLLALYEAERAGVRANDETWNRALRYWEQTQNKNGSWDYMGNVGSGTGSMTCAGIGSLVIANDRVQPPDAEVVGNAIKCCVASEKSETDRCIDEGIEWLGRNFSVTRNPGMAGTWNLYYLYSLERVGRLTARRFIGNHDWYREGADFLVRSQDRLSGSWSADGSAEISTSFALLFLSKGRWPTLLSKLKHKPSDDWNRHRHDANNLTRFVESRWNQDLTWQIVDLDAASADDLLQSPVLYFCGSANPIPDDPAKLVKMAGKLRDYLDRGGFLFAEAYCGDAGFDKGFRELMEIVFPEKEFKLQLLDPDHPVWHYEIAIEDKYLRPLYGIEYGCRTSVIYAPQDPVEAPRPSLSCLWELRRSGRGKEYPKTVREQIDAGLAYGVNILAYATKRDLKNKAEAWREIPRRKPGSRSEPGRIYLAKLRHPGGCNAAPRALANLLDLADRELKIRATAADDLVAIADESLFDYHLVFMHGKSRFHLTDEERKHLKAYLERGGMLMADSICASKEFTESFRDEMKAIFPDKKLEPIPTDDPLLTAKYGGCDLHRVSRYDPQNRDRETPAAAAIKKAPPELEGIKIDDRWSVIFSPYDLSCALEKHDSPECRGYLRADAVKIGLNIILYSLQQ